MDRLPTQAADPDSQVAAPDGLGGRQWFDLQSLTAQPEDMAAVPAAIGWEGSGGEQITHAGLDQSTDGGEGSEVLFAPAMSVTALAESAPTGSESLPHPAAGTVAASITEGSIGWDDVATAQVKDGIGDYQTAQLGLDGAAPFNVSDAGSAVLFAGPASAPLPPSLAGSANPTPLFEATPTIAGVGSSGVEGAGAGQVYGGLFGDQIAHIALGVTSPGDSAGIALADPSLAQTRPGPAPADLAHLANPPADFSGGAHTNASIGSSGATAAQVQQALDEAGLSLNGSGIKVGVLSDSFNNLGGAATDEANGALPSAAHIQVLSDYAAGGSDEGRAMMQIVHDIAPGANLAFYTAFNSAQDFANGILALAAAGCKVICDDVSYFD